MSLQADTAKRTDRLAKRPGAVAVHPVHEHTISGVLRHGPPLARTL